MKYAVAFLLGVALLAILAKAASVNNDLEEEKINEILEEEKINEIHREKRNAWFCKKIGDRTGWYCDDPATRWVWKILNWLRGVTDCNSFCKKAGNKGGSCTNEKKNYDTSTWCKKGETCMCI